jgi:hypothetical protein
MKKIITGITILGVTALTTVFALNFSPKTVTKAAYSLVVVTPDNTQGWTTADTRPGGNVNYVNDTSSPYPKGALALTTNSTTTAKAQYMHSTSTPLQDVTELGYYSKQVSGPVFANASYQLVVLLNGQPAGFTTFVFEPYQNTGQGSIVNNEWQNWDADEGQMWSTRSFTDSNNPGCSVMAGGGGAPFYTLSDLKTNCPDAVVISFGVNVGSNNPGYTVFVDGVQFNETVYNFELYKTVVNKDECKKDGYKNVRDENGNEFKNQGSCVSYVASKGRSVN